MRASCRRLTSWPNRLWVLGCALIAGLVLGLAGAHAEDAAPKTLHSIAVLPFELVDDQNNPATRSAQELRLQQSTERLRKDLLDRQLYRVADASPSDALQSKLRSEQEYLYRCDDCASQVGHLLNVDLVMTAWVQKVSELILNLNVQIYDVRAEKLAFSKSVDMRGNTDESWQRAVDYLVRDMAEKRERNPNYAQ